VWLAWADARDPEQPGWADMYLVELGASDLKLAGEARPLAATEPHSRSPSLVRRGDGAFIAWIEESAEVGGRAMDPKVLWGELDASTRFLAPPAALALEAARPASVTAECGVSGCRTLAFVQDGASAAAWGFVWDEAGVPHSAKLTGVTPPAAGIVGLAMLGDTAYFADGVGQSSRLRRLVASYAP
jgi:hypothetical protein